MHATSVLRIKILLTILICSLTGFSQAPRSSSRSSGARIRAPYLQYAKAYEETPFVTKVVLRNGMTVLVDERRVHPVVSVQLYIHAGYLDDPPQSGGMAALVAALAQRGAADKSLGTFRQQIQALGGIFCNITDYSTTLFEVVVPSNQWKRVLDIQAEGISNPSFEEGDVKQEARLLQSEAREILTDPEKSGSQQMLGLAFNQERMAKADTIRRSDLASITPEALATFYKKQYVPEKMLLVVSGDVNSSEILNEVVKLYAKPGSPATRSVAFPFSDSQSDFRFRSMRMDVAIPHVFIGYRIPAENKDDFKALTVLSAIAGLGEGSVLSSRVRDQKKLIVEQDTKIISYPEFAFLSIHAKVGASGLDRSEIAILTELELLKREEPTEAEMERALALLERSYWEEMETASGRASLIARYENLGDWKRMDQWIPALRKVTPLDVKRAAQKYLRLQNCTILEYVPMEGEERLLTEEGARQTFATLITPSTDQEQTERDKQTDLGAKIPPRSASFKFSEIRYPLQTASILRGPDLFIRESHSNPLIEMGLFYPGGKLDETQENGGITRLMMNLILKGGSENRQFYRQFEVYGGKVEPVITDDYFGFYLSVLSDNFEAAFLMLLEKLRDPSFEKEEVDRQKDLILSDLSTRRISKRHPMELMNRELFSGFPYSIPSEGAPSSITSITPESLKLWYETHVKNKKPVVALIGDTKGTSLASIFVRNFSGSRMQDLKLPEDFAKARGKMVSIDQNWVRPESLILVGFQAPPEDDEDGYTTAVLQAYIGNPGLYAQELIDKLGVAHRVEVVYHPRLRGGSLVVCAATDVGDEKSALDSLHEEIQRVQTGPILFRDFRSAVNEAVGGYQIRQQLRPLQIADIAETVMAGKGIESFRDYAGSLQDVDQDDFQAVARKVLDWDKAVVVVMHGKNDPVQ
jgi:zinc protease